MSVSPDSLSEATISGSQTPSSPRRTSKFGRGIQYLLEVVKGRKNDVVSAPHETHGRQQLQYQSLGSEKRRGRTRELGWGESGQQA